MKVTDGNISQILNGGKQFILPIYQRCYSWDIEQCETLWNDIVRMQQGHRHSHFIGSFVNIIEEATPTGIDKFLIIDGQQRITTLSLLMIALRNYAEAHSGETSISPLRIDNKILKNLGEEGLNQFKLILTETDKDVFIALVEKNENALKNVRSRLLDNYHFFLKRIEEQTLQPEQIDESIGKLHIVNITLERGTDDAQGIFESLNSTGKSLSDSDLIRNYMLMGLSAKEQTEIYHKLWRPMEELFSYETQAYMMDRFLRDFLTMKLGKIPKQNMVYDEFKHFLIDKDFENVRSVGQELLRHAEYYTDILYKSHNSPIRRALYEDINELRMGVAYPFLLYIHDACDAGKISEDELIEIIQLCINYVVRRSVCDIPTNSLNKTFATMRNSIREENFTASVKHFFIHLESYKEFPDNEKFVSVFKTRDIYHTRIRNFILHHLENFDNKAPIRVENYTVEHIMPQNPKLSEAWQKALGHEWKDIQKAKLHTIGNLTLTAYNSEMSDRSFPEKMEMKGGFMESALRLNRYIVKQSDWGLRQIEERANLLAETALHIWQYPILQEGEYNPHADDVDNSVEYTEDNYDFNEYNRTLFQVLDNNILNLSPDIRREYKKLYIAYKLETNFVDIIIQQNRLRLSLNMKFDEIQDPHHLCRDITGLGKWGNGDVELYFSDLSQIPLIMELIKQSYQKQTDEY